MQLLTLLAERAGTLVTRAEIRDALWPHGTFVEFDSAVNACVSQIRAVLDDKPSSPRFVETLPRRGYRFVAAVEIQRAEEAGSPLPPDPAPIDAAPPRDTRPPAPRSIAFTWAAVSLVAVVAIALWSFAASASRATAPAYAAGRSVEALQKYERAKGGLEDAAPGELADRVGFFNTAIQLSPDFAEAYAGLADAKLILATYRAEPPSFAYAAAKAAASKALAIDPSLGEAHAM